MFPLFQSLTSADTIIGLAIIRHHNFRLLLFCEIISPSSYLCRLCLFVSVSVSVSLSLVEEGHIYSAQIHSLEWCGT